MDLDVAHTNRQKAQQRRVILFSDALIYSKEVGNNQFKYRGEIPMHLAVLREFNGTIDKHKEYQYGFQLRTTENKRYQDENLIHCFRIYTFCCSSEYEKNEWMKDLNKVMFVLLSSISHSPVLTGQPNKTDLRVMCNC